MKVENINHGNLHIIEFDENDTQEFENKFDQYHIGKNIYDIPKDTIDELTEPKPKKIYVRQNAVDYKLYYTEEFVEESLFNTTVDLNKLTCKTLRNYDAKELINDIIDAEIEPELPLCYYPRDSKIFITLYIEEKVPHHFIYKDLLLGMVEDISAEYDLSESIPLYSYLLPHKELGSNISQASFNKAMRENIIALSDLF